MLQKILSSDRAFKERISGAHSGADDIDCSNKTIRRFKIQKTTRAAKAAADGHQHRPMAAVGAQRRGRSISQNNTMPGFSDTRKNLNFQR